MAFKIIWSRQARDDLRDIVSFIAANNRPVAESFGFRLMAKVDVLEQFPKIGRIVPEEQDESIREIILPP
jgi:toxin ParE1/3/4